MSASRLKYEKPMLIDFQDSERHQAQGACFPTGNSDAVSCGGGHAAGGTCFGNGQKAALSCSPHGSSAGGGSCKPFGAGG